MSFEMRHKAVGEREVQGSIAVTEWHHVVMPWGTDTNKVAEFLETRTEGRYSIQSFAVRFEDEKDAVIFKLGFRL